MQMVDYFNAVFFFFSPRREEFMHWVELLPDTHTPAWLGLPSNAEKLLLTTQGMRGRSPATAPSFIHFFILPKCLFFL